MQSVINAEIKKALIYCQFSSTRQKTDGHRLDSQEQRCRQYASSKRYSVDAVFPDDATGGGDFMLRPGMVQLLSYLDQNPDEPFVVIFDDLKRFARDREFHFKLRDVLATRGATVECLNFTFDDSPEGEFMETIFATQGQLEREQNRRQTLQKPKALLEAGYYTFSAPKGYKYERVEGHGKMLVRDEPVASIVQEALEGFASGRFRSQMEVVRFLQAHSAYPKGKVGRIHQTRVDELLNRKIYAGIISQKKWGVSPRLGKHEPLISIGTWERIQKRLKETANAPARPDLNAEFQLRGAVKCDCCNKPYRAAFFKSRNGKRHPYYLCQTRDCASYGKSTRRDEIEGGFVRIL